MGLLSQTSPIPRSPDGDNNLFDFFDGAPVCTVLLGVKYGKIMSVVNFHTLELELV